MTLFEGLEDRPRASISYFSSPEPVEIMHRADHAFVKRELRGCARAGCYKGKDHPLHKGAPPSLNAIVGKGNRHAYTSAKRTWGAVFAHLLEHADPQLPKPCGRLLVEGECCFPDRIRRDQGNYRFFIEKALGDALVEGGWLEDDDWSRYEFGQLAYRYERGQSWTRLLLMPA